MTSKSSNYGLKNITKQKILKKNYYKAPITEPIDEASSTIGSPIYSTVQPPTFSSINIISKPFDIGKDYLRQNFNSIENQVKREWFLSDFDLNAQSFVRKNGIYSWKDIMLMFLSSIGGQYCADGLC